MTNRVIIRPEAEKDLEETFSWYEDRREGLGYDFLLQVDSGFELLERNPYISEEGYKGSRTLLIRRFPYKIIYLIEKEIIFILAVIHGKRNPDLLSDMMDSL